MVAIDSSVLPLVTVVTPVYNIAKYIGEAVDSVIRQTFANFEYLVVDDGSDDGSGEVARKHARDDSRFRLVEGGHRGLSASRNTGIRQARGKYIAYLDGDDRWHPRFLERQIALIESLPEEVGAVFARCRMILENGTPAFWQRERPGRYDFDDLLVNNNPTRSGSALLIKKSCFADVGGFDEGLHYVEDFECWLRIAEGSKTPVMWANRQYLVDQRLRPGQVTRDRSSSDQAILRFLADQTPKLERFPAGLAYVRPAVIALKHGTDHDIAEKLAASARTVGVSELARSGWGRRFLFWDTLPPSARQIVRQAQSSAREAVKTANRKIRG